MLGAWDGKRLAGRVSAGALRRIFARMLLALAAVMLIGVIV